MITKTIAFLLYITFALMHDSTSTPTIISIDIEFCDNNKDFEKSICIIKEAELRSKNRLVIDQNANLNDIIIDKRSITSEKASAIFENGIVSIKEQNIINVPFLQKCILIRSGEYKVQELRSGYKIQIR